MKDLNRALKNHGTKMHVFALVRGSLSLNFVNLENFHESYHVQKQQWIQQISTEYRLMTLLEVWPEEDTTTGTAWLQLL